MTDQTTEAILDMWYSGDTAYDIERRVGVHHQRIMAIIQRARHNGDARAIKHPPGPKKGFWGGSVKEND